MFRSSTSLSSDKFLLLVMKNLWGANDSDLEKFKNDKSGRLHTPAVGWGGTPEKERYWANFHRLSHDYLARTQETNKLAKSYLGLFSERLDRYPLGEFSTVRIYDFLRKDMAECGIVSLAGSRILEVSPDLLQRMWDFDEIVASIAWGPPKWWNREAWGSARPLPCRVREVSGSRMGPNSIGGRDKPDADLDWEPMLVHGVLEELAKWMKASQFAPETRAGLVSILSIFGYSCFVSVPP